MSVLISCEVGGEHVPAQLVADAEAQANAKKKRKRKSTSPLSPIGGEHADEAAAYVARRMADRLNAPLIANEYSIQLIDVTRSLHHRELFPSGTRQWPAEWRDRLVDQIYEPYRARIRAGVQQLLNQFSYVIHLSIRTFPLRKAGKHQRADVGLLYDPARDDEVDLSLDWIDEMYEQMDMLRVRRNYPRRGTTDSLTRSMRAEFSEQNYLGIEVLLNRAWVGRRLPVRDEMIDGMCRCLQTVTSLTQSEAA